MPQALRPPCLIHLWHWQNSSSFLLAFWGNKNWPPSMKGEIFENCLNKSSFKGCKWSIFNAPGTQTPLSHSVLKLQFSLFSLLALWGNKNWPPSIKVKQIENCQNKMGLKGCKWSSLNAPSTQTPLSHSVLEWENLPFLTISLLG